MLSQNNEVLIYLQQHGSITPIDALREIGCFRLGARIYDLRKIGHDIGTRFETKDGKTYARYFMADDPRFSSGTDRLAEEMGRKASAI